MNRNNILKNSIVCGVLLLFLGVGFQPAFANEVEDCNCKPIISDSQIVRIERLLNRLESRINFILLRYSHIPGIEQMTPRLSEIINSNDFNSDFCDNLEELIIYLLSFEENMPFETWMLFYYIPWLALMYIWIRYCSAP